MTGVSKNTIVKLLVDLADACVGYHDAHVRNLKVRRLQCDEIWNFVGAKAKNVTVEQKAEGWGDTWTWTAIDADTTAYRLADQDFADRMGPGFIAARGGTIQDALNQLTTTPPDVTKAFTQNALIQSLQAFGGGNVGASEGAQGSAARNTAQASFANQILDKQDQDRAYINSLLQMFPERGYGLSGSDVANLSIANTGTLNANSQIGYNNQIASNAANYNAQIQTGQSIASIGSIIAGLARNFNTAPTGGYSGAWPGGA